MKIVRRTKGSKVIRKKTKLEQRGKLLLIGVISIILATIRHRQKLNNCPGVTA
jgi:hypothetical protein